MTMQLRARATESRTAVAERGGEPAFRAAVGFRKRRGASLPAALHTLWLRRKPRCRPRGLCSRDLDQTGAVAGDAPTTFGGDHERVFDADHAEAWHSLFGFQGYDHAFRLRLVKPLRDGGRFVHLQTDPVAEEIDAAIAVTHEILEELGVELVHDGSVDLRGDG